MTTRSNHPDDLVVWPDGTVATIEDLGRGAYDHMSDDYRVMTYEEAEVYEETGRIPKY